MYTTSCRVQATLLAATAATSAFLPSQSRVIDLDRNGSSVPDGFVTWRDATYFHATRYSTAGRPLAQSLWRTDGTAAGTRDLTPPGTTWRSVLELTPTADRLFFVTVDDATGRELWSTDGTPAGTSQVADIGPGPWSGMVQQLRVVGDVLFFVAATPYSTPFGTFYERNLELWRSDGTTAGTRLVVDLSPGLRSSVLGSGLRQLTTHDGLLYFGADPTQNNPGLYVSDGTASGTTRVSSFADRITRIESMDANLYLLSGGDLWVTSGGAASTRLLVRGTFRDVFPSTAAVFLTAGPNLSSWRNGQLTRLGNFRSTSWHRIVGGRLWFRGEQPGTGLEPWISDGTLAGTRLVADLVSGPAHGLVYGGGPFGPHYFTRPGNDDRVLFTADSPLGYQAWVSDGTSTGTRRLTSLSYQSRTFSGPIHYHRHDTRILFRSYDTFGDFELWSMPVAITEAPVLEHYGVGCDAAGQAPPRIRPTGLPLLGNSSFTLSLDGAGPGALTGLLAGPERARTAWTNCSPAISGTMSAFLIGADQAGQATLQLPIPRQPVFLGTAVAFQWAAIDITGSTTGRLDLTDGLRLIVGR